MGKKSKEAAGTPALVLLEQAGTAHTVRAYQHDDAATDFGAEAARELGVSAERVFKTLVLDVGNGRDLAVAVVPVNAKLDLKAAAIALGVKKVSLADKHLAAQRTGYVPGGISPLGQKKLLPTALDASALRLPSIYVSGGRRGLDVELGGADLARLTHATVAELAVRP
ncbi:Cys-tRNA(Pro) deacylase [Galactobacter caseinivorans]|uniref:Cys-tRNA(Pro)/Cys-tRNA(Cys) deacylase n=1 Tax=Galactobacter caseinivorans TaxID=2676123 RepID=A0A496PKH7_9MICC|nr:Cys-tRNA(Pro) deacylase [Galactobacter caseinivorans]RKW71012.1 Cys-tRNA(Pro) deacylase [Galactobacter caseinivorans]